MNWKTTLAAGLTVFLLAACNQESEADQKTEQKTMDAAPATSDSTTKVAQAAEAPTKPAPNADPHPGMEIHEQNCAACHMAPHDEAFYTRPDRKIQSYDKLQSMVRMCDANLGTQLFDEDMEQIGDYLNQAFYKFEK